MSKITAVRTIMPARLNEIVGLGHDIWSHLYKKGAVDKVVPLSECKGKNTSALVVNEKLLSVLELKMTKKRKGLWIIQNRANCRAWIDVNRAALRMPQSKQAASKKDPGQTTMMDAFLLQRVEAMEAAMEQLQAWKQEINFYVPNEWSKVLDHVENFQSIYQAVQVEHNKSDQRLKKLENEVEHRSQEASRIIAHTEKKLNGLLAQEDLQEAIRSQVSEHLSSGDVTIPPELMGICDDLAQEGEFKTAWRLLRTFTK